MKSDDDVEKLFSWLQTPDIRYREFADAREVTDTVLPDTTRSRTAEAPRPTQDTLQAKEEVSEHGESVSESASGPTRESEPTSAPTQSSPSTEQTRRSLDSVFNRLAGGRARDRGPTNGRPR